MHKNLHGQKGYKAAYNYKCRDVEVKVGKTLTQYGTPILCVNGFHYCKKPKDVLKHYSMSDSRINLFEVRDLSNQTHVGTDKCSTSKLKIVREITDPDEIFSLFGEYRKHNTHGVCVFYKYKDNYKQIKERFYNDLGVFLFEKTYSLKGNLIKEEFQNQKDYNKILKYYSGKGVLYSEVRWKAGVENAVYRMNNNIESYYNKDGHCIKEIGKNFEETTKYSKDNEVLNRKVVRFKNSRSGKVILHEKVVKNVRLNDILLRSYYKNINFEVKYKLNSDKKISEVKYGSGDFEKFEYDSRGRFVKYTNSIGSSVSISYKADAVKSFKIDIVNDVIPNYIASKYINNSNCVSEGYKNYKFLINSSNINLLINSSGLNLSECAHFMTNNLLDARFIVQ